jgi:hypothetical protein
MIDRDRLRSAHYAMRQICSGLMMAPAGLLVVYWFVRMEPTGTQADEAWVLTRTMVIVAGILVALMVLASVVLRTVTANRISRLTPGAADGLPSILSLQAMLGCGLWELLCVCAFVWVFMEGAPWALLAGATAFSWMGQALFFPRWSAWERVADSLEPLGYHLVR